jgi:hypothetical protein
VLVFQYGSNCAEAQINSKDRLCGDAKFIGIAKTVEDFELAFDVWSNNRRCAASDIVAKPGRKVWGALYEVPDYLIRRETANPRNRRSLDAIEGESTNYRQYIIRIQQPNHEPVDALTYVVKDPKPGLRTSLEYVGYIVHGLRERGVDAADATYLAEVKRIAAASNPDIAKSVDAL